MQQGRGAITANRTGESLGSPDDARSYYAFMPAYCLAVKSCWAPIVGPRVKSAAPLVCGIGAVTCPGPPEPGTRTCLVGARHFLGEYPLVAPFTCSVS